MAVGDVEIMNHDFGLPMDDGKMTAESIDMIGFTYDELCELYAQVMNERDSLLEKNATLELKIATLERVSS